MEILINRFNRTQKSTVSDLIVNNIWHSFCLEDPVREEFIDGEWEWSPEDKIYGNTAIPSGTYKTIVTHSNRFNKKLPLLLDVPSFKGIRIHPGNAPKNTEGCLLPGADWVKKKPNWVGSSKKAFNPLYRLIVEALDDNQDVNITITNNF